MFGSELAQPPPPVLEATDPMIGSKVGSFQIVRPLGRGGMGTVYLGEHPAIGSKVAVKFLHESMASDPELVARFYDEARAVNLVGHENIIGVYDLAVLPPRRFYYVMEYLEGETLAAVMKRGRPAPVMSLEVLLQLCDALHCAHAQGVVHRDLKPENVFLVSRRGSSHFVKLVDFGIAKLRGALAGRTQSGVLVGTPEYMSPEQCDDGPIDARTDVYALGVMAFELFTGQLPFTTRSTPQLLLAHLTKPPPRPSELCPIAEDLEAAILKALAKSPAARFQSMAELAEALRPVLARLRAEAPAPAPTPAPVATPTPDRPAAPAPAPRPAAPPPAQGIEATLSGSAPPRRFAVVELTRAGAFLQTDGGPLPPLFSRAALSLEHPSLRAPLAVQADVVRHVGPEEAARFRMAPGFAVQLVELTPEIRAAVAELADAERPASGPGALPPAPDPDGRLTALESQSGGTPYVTLGVPPDAEFSEIRRAAASLREELEALRLRPLSPSHPGRATALLARIEVAVAAVGAPAARLAHDARVGNWRGVQRCLRAGVPANLVEARRRELLAAEPKRAQEAQRQLARAQVASKLGNRPAAEAAWEAALAADPLDTVALEAYVAFRRAAG